MLNRLDVQTLSINKHKLFKCYLEYAVSPRTFENNILCKIWGPDKVYYGEFENGKLAYVNNFVNFYHALPKTVLFGCSLNSDISIPEDIEEQLSLSSFHSGSAKVCHVSYGCAGRKSMWTGVEC